MTTRTKHRALIGGLIITVVALAATLLPTLASPIGGDQVRDIHLVVRDMTFYVEGQDDPNPAIMLRAGEQVRITLRNEDAGMRHDFAVKAWAVGTRVLDEAGEADAFVFRVPRKTGDQVYVCTPHSKRMRGVIRVE